MPTTHRNGTEPTLVPPPAYDHVEVTITYRLRVPVPGRFARDPDAAECYVEDLLARLPETDQLPFYVENSERSTFTAQEGRTP